MQLIEALRFSGRSELVFVGAGGKSTALFKAGRELSGNPDEPGRFKTVLVTTTTHFGAWQAKLADHWIKICSQDDLEELEKAILEGVVLLTGEESNDRLGGLPLELIEKVHALAENHVIPLLIEADGAHLKPLKAPAQHEPVIPEFAQHIIVVAGLIGLGKPLTDEWVHRSEIFAKLSGVKSGEQVSIDAIVKVLRHQDGGLKNIPAGARRTAILNQADNLDLQLRAREIAEQLMPEYHSVLIATLSEGKSGATGKTENIQDKQEPVIAVIERIAGIVLAAGGSSRFGIPKQLLMWKGEPVIRHVTKLALKAGLSPVIVVVGSSAGQVQAAINDLPVRIVNNEDWMDGMSSSIRAGIQALPEHTGGAVFLQVDQPQIPAELINSLVNVHQTTLCPITIPRINGQRGNPVLFDCSTFSRLLSLEGDVGGRALFTQLPTQWVDWPDQNLLFDIDTPEDYTKFLKIYPGDEEAA